MSREDAGRPLGRKLAGTSLGLMEQEVYVGTHAYRLVVPETADQVHAPVMPLPVSRCRLLRRTVPTAGPACQVLDHYIRRGHNDADPYWCRPWPSAIALAARLAAEPQLVAGRRVIELGCGLGLAGIAAAWAGVLHKLQCHELQCPWRSWH